MESIELGILGKPYIFATIVVFLSIFDEILPKISRAIYLRGHNQYFSYTTGMRDEFYTGNRLAKWIIRLIAPVMLVLIYHLAVLSEDSRSMNIYLMFAGFALFNYLIVDLRHTQNILLYNLTMDNPDKFKPVDLEGELLIGNRFSLRQSAIQIFTIALLLFAVFIFQPSYFLAGAIIAPIFLTVRNLIVAGMFRG